MFEIIGTIVLIYIAGKCFMALRAIESDEEKNDKRTNDGWLDYRT